MLDIDSIDLPAELSSVSENTDAILSRVVSNLPASFHGVSFYYQFSASMCVKPGSIRVHLWFWLNRAVSDAELKVWLDGYPVDHAIFNAVQPHFTADPVFEYLEDDPLPQRSGFYDYFEKRSEVCVPDNLNLGLRVRKRVSKVTGVASPSDRQGIVRDPLSRKVVDGRERFLLMCSNIATTQLVQDRHVTRPPTADEIAKRTWEIFTADADTTDGKWTERDAFLEAIRRKADLDAGTYSFTGRTSNTMLYPASEPYHKISTVDKETGTAKLEEVLEEYFDDQANAPRVALRVTMGAGKTYQTVEQLCRYLSDQVGVVVEIYAPNHEMVADYERQLADLQVNAEVVHVLPRTGGTKGNLRVLCQRHEYVRSLERAGLSVFKNACEGGGDSGESLERCEFFRDCPYILQFGLDDPVTRVVNKVFLFPHAYLFLRRNRLQPPPNIVIVDEAFLMGSVETVSIKSNIVRQSLVNNDAPDLGKLVYHAIVDGGPALHNLRKAGIGIPQLNKVDLSSFEPRVKFDPRRSTELQLKPNGPYRALSALLDVLKQELRLGTRDNLERVTYDPDTDDIIVSQARPLEIPDEASLLLLDATADPQLLTRLVGPVEFHRVAIEQKGIVTQVYDRTGSKSFWEDNGIVAELTLEA
ncbi:hypothetical protein [Palleronia sp. LCG004]|uniref:hypothetical protein n=1 Tax=Palleronia sp. LCG004 TaxID=3079304 RepID=UPI002942726E|nr:hypothetical protein [Palleronia sp. LCG004]WOI56837.1 hypothetical protein RVY76_03310 [Palleronia sp. LCG004]